MKTFRNTMLIIFIIIAESVFSQDDPLGWNIEIAVQNHTGANIEVQLHPVSAVYRVMDNPGPPSYDKWYYTLTAKARNYLSQPNYYDYINGMHYISNGAGYIPVYKNEIAYNNTNYEGWADDFHGNIGGNPDAFGTYGYGNYKFIIKNLSTNRIDSCIIMLDYHSNFLSWGTPGDCYLYIYPDNVEPRFYYQFFRHSPPANDQIEINYNTPDGYTLRSWAPNGLGNPLNRRDKELGPDGGFELVDLPETNNKDFFPLDSRKDCYDVIPLFHYNCNQNQIYPEEGFDERHGIIPLNLTIKKKIVTPITQTYGYPANLLISVEPSVTLTIDKCPAPNPINSGFFLNPYQNTSNGNDLVLKSTDQTPKTTLKLTAGNNNIYDNSKISVRNNCKIIAESNTLIDLGDYSQIFLERLAAQTTDITAKLILENNSNVNFGLNSEINVNAYGEFINEGANITYTEGSNAQIIVRGNGLYELKPNVLHTVNNEGKVFIKDGSQLKLDDNSRLVFDGDNCCLQIDASSTITLGQNATIEFINGAYLIANGSTIAGVDASNLGKGLVFENSGQNTISGCTFSFLSNPISIYNTPVFFGNIYNNTFNTNNDCDNMIDATNTRNITISYNQIHMQSDKGVGILMRYIPTKEENQVAAVSRIVPTYNVNVFNNVITDGVMSAAFIGFASEYANIMIRNNICYGSVSGVNIYERQMTGDLRYNNISTSTGENLNLFQSIPNVLSNTFNSSGLNIYNVSSYPNLSPISNVNSTDAGIIWTGGKNSFTSTGNSNINFDNGNVILDWGQNVFIKNANYHHLEGIIDQSSLSYYVRNNCFNGNHLPNSDLLDVNSNNIVTPYIAGSTFVCNNTTDAGTIWQIRDLGNDVSDTLYQTIDNRGEQPLPDEVLYNTALEKKELGEYVEAISYYKSLITGFPTSSNTDYCVYSLYECYQALDTGNNQSLSNILYTDLKNYFNGRLLTEQYSEDFNYTAYNVTLMCLTSIEDYDNAMTGYEFLALYYPEAYARLLASWDYAEVEALSMRTGGISSKEENMTDEEYFTKLTDRVNKSIDIDPIKKKVKKSFDKIKADKTAKVEKEVLSRTKDEKAVKHELAKIRQTDEMMNTKVNSVMRYSKTLSKSERSKKQVDDILFSKKIKNSNVAILNTVVPDKYELSQNYPNPFNPTTKINYALPKTGLITMKIYDVTGREIKVLVNEVKQAGYYTIDFNASNFASGVYFYRIIAGDFISTKRMVLIK
jgi:hypothetical protein